MSTSTDKVTTVRVNIPTALRAFTDEARTVELPGRTVGEVLGNLASRFPRLRQHLFDDAGEIRSFVSVYVGDEDIRHLDHGDTVVDAGQELSIVPSIAGGLAA